MLALTLVLLAACGDQSQTEPSTPTTPEVPPAEVTMVPQNAEADASADVAPRVAEAPTARRPAFADATVESHVAEPLAAPACQAGDPVQLGSSDVRRPGVVATHDTSGFVVAWTTEETAVHIARLGADAAPSGAPIAATIPAAMDLSSIRRVDSRFLLHSHGLCPRTRNAMKCYQFLVLGSDLQPIGEAFQHQTGEWASGIFVTTADGVVVLRSHTYLAPVLERYRIAADGSISREELGDLSHGVERGEDEPPKGIALAVDGDRIAAIVRHELEAGTRYYLYRPGAETVRVSGLRRDIGGREMVFVGDELQLVVTDTNARASLAVLSLSGELRDGPSPLGPLPYGELGGGAFGDRAPVGFTRHDEAGRRVGPNISGLPAARTATAAGTRDSFVIVSVEGARAPREVVARPVRCGS